MARFYDAAGNAVIMPKHRRLLILVADGEHARFVRPRPDNALQSETVIDSRAAHRRSAELRTDRPGASFHTGSTAHHAETPRKDPHVLETEHFAKLIANQLNNTVARGEVDEFVVVAPPHVLSAIRKNLDAAADAKIVGTLKKDLVKTPDDELWPHVRTWVRPAHRAS